MNILGINGWDNWFHDTSASLIVNGQLVAICEEERFTRRKHANTAPVNAARWCLRSTALEWNELDALCLGWNLDFYGPMLSPPFTHDDLARKLLADLDAPGDFPLEKIHFFDHHRCHALSVIGFSPGHNGLVLVMDGQGEERSISMYSYENGSLTAAFTLGPEHSLGFFYEAASSAAGFGLNGTGKLMGLSSFGMARLDFFDGDEQATGLSLKFPQSFQKPKVQSDDFDDAKRTVDDYWLPLFYEKFCGLPEFAGHDALPFELREGLHHHPIVRDFAASAQKSLEKAVEQMVGRHLRNTDTRIFLAGGVALNCKNNGALLASLGVELLVQPLSNDAGVSLGAAFYYAQQQNAKVGAGDFPFVGPSFSGEEIRAAIESRGLNYTCVDEPWHTGAELIAQGYIIGWFQGKAEAGPRALGARSILAKPDSALVRDRINKELKKRESWRPFGPSVLEEHAHSYFDKCISSRYMLIGFQAKPEAKSTFAGTIHVDGTSRVQTVPLDSPNRLFRTLLESYYSLSGIPGVLNTSFNRAGEPIVCTPEDALTAFIAMGLDALMIGQYLIKRIKTERK
ncbi:carbamoyltransferase C-terminal domain-containing protein [soil metagenome]